MLKRCQGEVGDGVVAGERVGGREYGVWVKDFYLMRGARCSKDTSLSKADSGA